MPDFSLEVSPDVSDMRKWVHEFAETVIRPAAAEWDEREETPWPVIQEAAKVGLYSLDFFSTQWFEPSGLGIPVAMEEIFWGDAGIGLAIVGTTLAAVAMVANGTPEQTAEWVPQMFGDENDVKVAAFCSSEPEAGSDVGNIKTRAVYRREDRRVGAERHQDLGHQRRHRECPRRRRHASTRRWVPAGRSSFVIPPGTKGLSQGQKFAKHGIRASHTAEVVLDDCRIPASCVLGGKEKLDERLARAREGVRSKGNASMATFEASRPSVAAQAVGIARAAYEYARDYASAARAVRPADRRKPGQSPSSSPTWRPGSMRPGC